MCDLHRLSNHEERNHHWLQDGLACLTIDLAMIVAPPRIYIRPTIAFLLTLASPCRPFKSVNTVASARHHYSVIVPCCDCEHFLVDECRDFMQVCLFLPKVEFGRAAYPKTSMCVVSRDSELTLIPLFKLR
jgi:hypothetical protein